MARIFFIIPFFSSLKKAAPSKLQKNFWTKKVYFKNIFALKINGKQLSILLSLIASWSWHRHNFFIANYFLFSFTPIYKIENTKYWTVSIGLIVTCTKYLAFQPRRNTNVIIIGVARGVLGCPWPPPFCKPFLTYNRWRKCHDDILTIVKKPFF